MYYEPDICLLGWLAVLVDELVSLVEWMALHSELQINFICVKNRLGIFHKWSWFEGMRSTMDLIESGIMHTPSSTKPHKEILLSTLVPEVKPCACPLGGTGKISLWGLVLEGVCMIPDSMRSMVDLIPSNQLHL
jgi:hypothetical protein